MTTVAGRGDPGRGRSEVAGRRSRTRHHDGPVIPKRPPSSRRRAHRGGRLRAMRSRARGPRELAPAPAVPVRARRRAPLRHRALLPHRPRRGAGCRRVGLGDRNDEVGVADDRQRSGCRNRVPGRGSFAHRGQSAVRDGNRRPDAPHLRLGVASRRPAGGLRRRRHAADAGSQRCRHHGPVPACSARTSGKTSDTPRPRPASDRELQTSPDTSEATSPSSSAGNGRFTYWT